MKHADGVQNVWRFASKAQKGYTPSLTHLRQNLADSSPPTVCTYCTWNATHVHVHVVAESCSTAVALKLNRHVDSMGAYTRTL